MFYESMHLNTETLWVFVQDRFNPPLMKRDGTGEPMSSNRSWKGSGTWFEGCCKSVGLCLYSALYLLLEEASVLPYRYLARKTIGQFSTISPLSSLSKQNLTNPGVFSKILVCPRARDQSSRAPYPKRRNLDLIQFNGVCTKILLEESAGELCPKKNISYDIGGESLPQIISILIYQEYSSQHAPLLKMTTNLPCVFN